MTMKSFDRTQRVASLLKEAISEALLFSVSDPRLQGVVVTRVFVTKDLSICRVYFRHYSLTRDEVMEGLQACRGFLRKEVGHKVRLLRTPDFEFFYDDLPDKVLEVEALLEKVKDG
jgi:ribosome-binding factor A